MERCECGKTFQNLAGLKSHINWCDGDGLISEKPSALVCKHCKREFTNKSKLGGHVRWCKSNPNPIAPPGFANVSSQHRAEINRRINADPEKIRKTTKRLKEYYKDGECGINKTTATTAQKKNWRKRLLAGHKKRKNVGGYRRGSGRSTGCWYDSDIAGRVWLDSSYELALAEYYDNNNVKWERNTKKFEYKWQGKTLHYIPDFFLPDDNLYIEVKGYETEKDRAKWSNFPHELRILRKEDLNRLGCNVL